VADPRRGRSAIGPRELRWLRPLVVFATAVLITAVLYWARVVLIPIALAALLAFLLGPLVTRLQRRGLARTVAVIVVVALAFSVLGGIAWVLVIQITGLADDLPLYRSTIKEKIADARTLGRDTAFGRVQRLLDEVLGEIRREEPARERTDEPVAVVVQPDRQAYARELLQWAEPLVTFGVVLALTIFMLVRRGELRDRLIRLGGFGRVPLTTKALDEAAERITHYLGMQVAINGTFGVLVGIGLALIGLPYAILWGFLAGILRFVPYIGAWLSALMPLALSVAVFPTWSQSLMVGAFFLVLEPLIFLVIEPLLYGTTAGVSEVALLVAVAFWTWLWGPVGLILATPLTVCLVVLGRHVPELELIAVMLGDEPVLEPHLACYQRLLAGDQDEAAEIVESYAASQGAERVPDEVLLPALRALRRDLDRGRLTDEDAQLVITAIREIADGLGSGAEVVRPPEPGTFAEACARLGILGCPARDEMDHAGLVMLGELLGPGGPLDLASPQLLSAEMVAIAAERRPAIVCVAALPPGGMAHARYLLKRLRRELPDARILVGRWGRNGPPEETRQQLLAAGADEVGMTLLETRDQILRLLPLLAGGTGEEPGAPVPALEPQTA
jgi:predicted PurR-regulated permease PerM